MALYNELKRRNVFRVSVAYLVVSWLLVQVGDALAPALQLPAGVSSMLAFFLILGFPVAVLFAWVYEITPEGVKREKDVDRTTSITQLTGRKLDFIIVGLLTIAIAYFALDKYVLNPQQAIEEPSETIGSTPSQPSAES